MTARTLGSSSGKLLSRTDLYKRVCNCQRVCCESKCGNGKGTRSQGEQRRVAASGNCEIIACRIPHSLLTVRSRRILSLG